MKHARLVLAFIMAPILPLCILAAAEHFRAGTITFLWLQALIAYLITLLLGTPAFFILRRKGWLQWWAFVCVSFGIVAIPTLILLYFSLSSYSNYTQGTAELVSNHRITMAGFTWLASATVSSGGLGAIGGIVFWIIGLAKKIRP